MGRPERGVCSVLVLPQRNSENYLSIILSDGVNSPQFLLRDLSVSVKDLSFTITVKSIIC